MSAISPGYAAGLRWFKIGISAAFVFLIFSYLSGHTYSRLQLIWYDLAAIIHVLFMFFASREEGERVPGPRVAQILYTAGFIHTLLAIGLALLSITHLLQTEGSVELSRLLNVITPLGAAVLPHAFAVFLGLLCESAATEEAAGSEDFFRALAEDARRASLTLSALYARRAQALEEEIRQIGEVTGRMSTLGAAADSAVSSSASRISEIERSLSGLTAQVSTLAGDLQKAYASASASVGALGGSAASVASSINKAAPESARLANELSTAVETVRKLNELQRAIVELIAATTFEARK